MSGEWPWRGKHRWKNGTKCRYCGMNREFDRETMYTCHWHDGGERQLTPGTCERDKILTAMNGETYGR